MLPSPGPMPPTSAAPASAPPGRRQLLQRVAALTGGAALPWLAACSKQAPAPAAARTATGTTESGATGKVYAIGTDAANAPFESQNDKGDTVGFDIELLQSLAAKAGIEVEIINTPWEGLLTALAQGDLDAAISAIVITEERRQALDFSAPYFEARQVILVPAASKVQRLQDLKTLKVGVQNGGAADDLLSPMFSKHAAALQRFESIPLALTELEAGTVQAVVADNGVLAHYVTNGGAGAAYRLVTDPAFEPEQYGIAVKKGNRELLGKLDAALVSAKADGSYMALHARYFGAAAAR